jgi:Uma2 family endonuclease
MNEFPSRVETVQITDGLSVLEIAEGHNGLLFEGRLIALEWSDCEGSIGQMLFRANDDTYQAAAQTMFELPEIEIDSLVPLAVQIAPILKLFGNGSYKIACWTKKFGDCYIADLDPEKQFEEDHYYPNPSLLLRTIPKATLNESRIAYWIDQIQAGARPSVLAASSKTGYSVFIIDGHHRLEAYLRLSVDPQFISIRAVSSRILDLSLIDDFLQHSPKMLEHFHEVRPKSIDDLLALPANVRAELFGRRLEVLPTSNDVNPTASDIILTSLQAHAQVKAGQAYPSNAVYIVENRKFPIDEKYIKYAPHRSFSPDVSFHTGTPTETRFLEGVPVFAVEMRNSGDYHPYADGNREMKRANYFACGTLVVWDVDLIGQDVIRSYRSDQPDTPTVFRRGEVATADPAIPGWMFQVNELFE